MAIDLWWKDEHVFMRTSLDGTPFMYMYSTLFSHLHLIVPFNRFKVDVLMELNVAPT